MENSLKNRKNKMKYLIKNKNWDLQKDYDVNKILYLLIDRPNEINHWNDFIWINKQKLHHRDYDLPTILEKMVIWFGIKMAIVIKQQTCCDFQ